MRLKTISLYKKNGVDKENIVYKNVLAKIQEPSIQAKSWYQMNTNHSLENIITFRGEIEDFKTYDAVKIGDRTYYITGLTANGNKSLRLEVGI